MNPIKIIKKCAKQKLYADWFTHIAVFVGFFAISCAILFGGAACVMLLGRYAHLSEADFALLDSVYAIFVVLCVIPLAYGVLTYAVHVTDGQAADVMDLFCAFGSGKTFCRSFTLLWSLFWRAVLVFALPVYFVSQADILLYEENFLYTDIGGFGVGYFLISTGLFIAFFAAFRRHLFCDKTRKRPAFRMLFRRSLCAESGSGSKRLCTPVYSVSSVISTLVIYLRHFIFDLHRAVYPACFF